MPDSPDFNRPHFPSHVIINARLPQRTGLYQITLAGDLEGRFCPTVLAITPMAESTTAQATPPNAAPLDATPSVTPSDVTVLDVQGDWVSLGAVDLQINGALGLAFPDLRVAECDRLQSIREFLWQQGVDGFCPTLVTTSLENFQGSLAAIAQCQATQSKDSASNTQAAKVLGAHLEGPFLNPSKRGAHPEEFLQPLTLDRLKAVIGDFETAVSIVTLAPEIEVEEGAIGWLRDCNITVSLGHSLATAQQATRAFDQGATMVTHAFNAMPGLHHREPGLLGAALTDARVFCGFIADGEHICPTMLDWMLRAGRGSQGPASNQTLGGLFLVSDALSPLGLPDGTYPWDTRQIEVTQGTARLADGTLSGTTLPLIAGAQNLVKWGLCSVEEAIALVAQAPREALGLPNLAIGSPAHLLRWQQTALGELTWQRLKL
jgi:N-acetylglucosamine-6-phosphate deacetylase